MNDSHMQSISQLENFLKVGQDLSFSGNSRKEKYKWIEWTLFKFRYFHLSKKDKSVVKKYMMKMTGYSDAQAGRLIKKKKDTNRILVRQGNRNKFKKVYSSADVALLIKVDTAHQSLSGPATKDILKREYEVYGKKEYANISHISCSHIYNLRSTNQYRSRLGSFEKTKPVNTNIGKRIKPDNQGKPGYIRVDTVHQGDYVDEHGQKKGVYHINLVDEVVQWEIAGSVEGISERFLVPLLEQLIKQFPFKIINFHSDNGSEYINKIVAQLLNKLNIDQTKSRPRHSNDNGLVETKNGSVIRKHMGYAYIEQKQADKINLFYHTYLNPYLNFHRPCAYPTRIPDLKKKGKIKVVYRQEDYMVPLQKLISIPDIESYLKPGITVDLLKQFAGQMSDTEAAEVMQKAKYELFKSFKKN